VQFGGVNTLAYDSEVRITLKVILYLSVWTLYFKNFMDKKNCVYSSSGFDTEK